MKGLIAWKHRFFGTDLPARSLPLNFTLPNASQRFKASRSSDGEFARAIKEAREIPSEYFSLLMAQIRHINRCNMKPQQRLKLMRDTAQYFYPMALAQIARHASTGGVPEDEERRKVLKLLVDVAQTLIVSYQILFLFHYASSNFKYVRARSTVLECASRIFELMSLKQQTLALQYRLLDAQDWQLANTLFYVMSCYEDVEEPVVTLRKALDLAGGRSTVCLREQFSLLHMVARFDMLRWPTHLQWVVGNYVANVENAVRVNVDTGNLKLERNELVAYCYGQNSATGNVPAVAPGPAMVLNCSALTDAIRKDCIGLIQSKKDRGFMVPPRFARMPEAEHFVISDQLVRGLQTVDDNPEMEKEIKVEDLRIFVGFNEVFSLLHHKLGRYASEVRLADMLAKRSAQIAEDEIATDKSVWSLLVQNDKMIRLSTQETAFTTPMIIGSLLAYGIGEDINRPSLAVVARIFRPTLKTVVIDIHSIASYAEPVMMTVNADDSSMGQNRAKPALLVYNQKRLGGWGLMFPPQDVVLGFDRIGIHRKGQALALAMKARINATNDFYLFSTPILSDQLGITGEPDYPTPAVRKTHPAGWLL